MLHESESPRLETRRTRSADGTLIAYYTTEAPGPDAPALVLAGGLAGHYRAWSPQIRYFADRYRIVTWDYRGLFGSSHPIPGGPESYGMAGQLQDLQAVLEAEQLDRFALIGWSMGVQVSLEACHHMAERVRCLVLISGTPSRPVESLARIPGIGRLVGAAGLTALGRQLISAALHTPARRRRVAATLRKLGLVAETVDSELIELLVGDISDLSLTAWARTMETLFSHDASDLLTSITIPTLVVTGDRDPFTPPALAQSMARHIPNSEILVVPGGRHYVCLEFPDLVNLRLERFFDDVGLRG